MTDQLSNILSQAMSLPVTDRVALAQRLWESLDAPADEDNTDEADVLTEAKRRDAQLEGNPDSRRPHEEVMKAARKAVQ